MRTFLPGGNNLLKLLSGVYLTTIDEVEVVVGALKPQQYDMTLNREEEEVFEVQVQGVFQPQFKLWLMMIKCWFILQASQSSRQTDRSIHNNVPSGEIYNYFGLFPYEIKLSS